MKNNQNKKENKSRLHKVLKINKEKMKLRILELILKDNF